MALSYKHVINPVGQIDNHILREMFEDIFLAARLLDYRRPVLEWVSITTVDVEANTDTSGQRAILFPDGIYRTTTSSTSYRFDITRNAVLSGSVQSGLRTSLSETANTWYSIYAVKVTDNSTNWVAVGDTLLPVQANVSTLNSNFGVNGWVYLGLIRNGDDAGSTSDILDFVQDGNKTVFRNEATHTNVQSSSGIKMASTAGATSVTYTYASGTGSQQIPSIIHIVDWVDSAQLNDTGVWSTTDSGATKFYWRESVAATGTEVRTLANKAASLGLKGTTPNAGDAHALFLVGFFDRILGTSSNPKV